MTWSSSEILAAIALLGTLGTIIYQFYLASNEKRAKNAEAIQGESSGAEAVSRAATLLVSPLEDKIRKQECEIERLAAQLTAEIAKRQVLENEVRELRAGVALLTQQITSAGLEPLYKPRLKPA